MTSGLEAGFLLDRQWHLMRGEMDNTKKSTLLTLGRLLHELRIPYAIIGGVALQVHHPDPRTTLDIDVAVLTPDAIPRDAMIAAGFRQTGSFEHSENWVSTDGTPVQFTNDPALADAISAAAAVNLEGVALRVISVVDLLHEKVRAFSDPARRLSKRFQDRGDVQALIEANPDLANHLRPDEREALAKLPR